MDKIKDFISAEEHLQLKDWAYSMREHLQVNFRYRYFRVLTEMPKNKLVETIKRRVLEAYGLEDVPRIDGGLGSILSWHEEGGFVQPHTDKYEDNKHYRFNLILSLPKEGGIPIYNGKELEVEERMLLPYDAGEYLHSSTKTVGDTPRIMLSFGWLFDKEVKLKFKQGL